MTATGFLIALINRKGKSDVSSIEISDMRTKYRTSDYLIVVETRIDLISHPTDIIYVRPILKKKKSWISADFLKKSEPNEALDGENGEVVWKLQFRVYNNCNTVYYNTVYRISRNFFNSNPFRHPNTAGP